MVRRQAAFHSVFVICVSRSQKPMQSASVLPPPPGALGANSLGLWCGCPGESARVLGAEPPVANCVDSCGDSGREGSELRQRRSKRGRSCARVRRRRRRRGACLERGSPAGVGVGARRVEAWPDDALGCRAPPPRPPPPRAAAALERSASASRVAVASRQEARNADMGSPSVSGRRPYAQRTAARNPSCPDWATRGARCARAERDRLPLEGGGKTRHELAPPSCSNCAACMSWRS